MNVVAFMIVGPGEADKFLEPTLKQLVPLADKIAICLNNADAKTRRLCEEYADLLIEDPREWGKNQHRIKEDFLRNHVAKLKPDWIICLDADEIFDKRFTREKLEELASSPTDIAYQFWCIQLWNDDRHWRKDLSFPNIRFYKFIPEYGLHWHPTPLHCGLAPEYAYKYPTQTNLIFKHYGLMRAEDRKKKVARYNKYDPQAKYKGRTWYQGLANERITPEPFVENEEFYAKLPELIPRKKLPKMFKHKPKGKVYLFRNPHGKIVPAEGEKIRDQYLKTPGFTLVQELNNAPRNVEAPVISSPEVEVAPEPVKSIQETVEKQKAPWEERRDQPGLEQKLEDLGNPDKDPCKCDICGRVCRTPNGMKIHRKAHG